MKRLIQFTLCSVAVLASILLVGCTDDVTMDTPASGGEGVVFNFVVDDLDVATENQGSAATKAAADDAEHMTEIKNMWIVQYDDAGEFLDKEYFSTFTTTDCVNLADNVSDIIFIANTFNANLITNNITLENLKALKIDTLFGSDGTKDYFILNGTIVDYDSKQGATVILKRNVAKVNVVVKNNLKGYTLSQIKVCNIPTKSSIYTNYTDATIAATAFEKGKVIKSGDTFYIPANQQGTDDTIKSTKDKPTSSLATNATYVVVKLKKNNEYIARTYTFYLGANMTDDFNIIANNIYNYTFKINAAGDAELDDRVEVGSSVEFIPIAYPEDIQTWIDAHGSNTKALNGLKLAGEFIDFQYSDAEVEGSNWRFTTDVINEVASSYINGKTINDFPNYGIKAYNSDLSDDVLPQLKTICGDDVELPTREELIYMYVFWKKDFDTYGELDNSATLNYWSSTQSEGTLNSDIKERYSFYFCNFYSSRYSAADIATGCAARAAKPILQPTVE